MLTGLVAVFLVVEILKNLLKHDQILSLFLVECEDGRRAAEIEHAPPYGSEVPFVPQRDETTRRRVPHSVSLIEKSYGSINPLCS